jgi:hypothetical protein
MELLTEREKILVLKANQKFHNYEILSKEPCEDGQIAKPLGEDSSGIVYITLNLKRSMDFE